MVNGSLWIGLQLVSSVNSLRMMLKTISGLRLTIRLYNDILRYVWRYLDGQMSWPATTDMMLCYLSLCAVVLYGLTLYNLNLIVLSPCRRCRLYKFRITRVEKVILCKFGNFGTEIFFSFQCPLALFLFKTDLDACACIR